jgi:hypothetical protein
MTFDPAIKGEAQRLLLGDRVPAQAVIEELMAVRERDQPRSLLGRILGADR